MHIVECNATVIHCFFTENLGSGMGIYGSNANLVNCIFRGNGYGGIHTIESNATLIDCIFSENSSLNGGGMYNVESSLTLTNCTFTGNSAYLAKLDYGYGGGMYNIESSLTLTNCTFIGNSAREGGGICNFNDSNITLSNCTFNENSAHRGGGMCNKDSSLTLADCTFSGNSADYQHGGGIYCEDSSPTITNCAFTDNTSNEGGGGIYLYRHPSPPEPPPPPKPPIPPPLSVGAQSSPEVLSDGDLLGATVTNCIFSGNSANWGGGMMNGGSNTTLTKCIFRDKCARYSGGGMSNGVGSTTLTNCTFSGNSASDGGGMYNTGSNLTLLNCIFSGNRASDSGGGMHCLAQCTPTLANCTFALNSAENGNALACDSMWQNFQSDVEATNCIFGDGGNEIWNNDGSTIIITYSDVSSGWPGEGNIYANPCFIDPGYWADPNESDIVVEPNNPGAIWVDGDYHLLPISPCIDAGDNAAVGLTTDLDGKERIVNGIVDMGAYEHQGPRQRRQFYVDDDATGENNGSSWADAYNYLQDALAAAWRGDEIRVTQGVYKPDQGVGITPGDREATFQLKNGVTVKGGYAGFDSQDPNERDIYAYETILSGDLVCNDRVLNDPRKLLNDPCRVENSYHVVTGSRTDETAVLDGFTITAGNDDSHYYDPWHGWVTFGKGGGMYNYVGNPKVTKCTFTENSSNWVGGGMYNYQSNATLANCIFSKNSADEGGGMFNFEGNPMIAKCTFIANSASQAGGGIYNLQLSPTITNCTFSCNSAYQGGGLCNSWSSSPRLINCTFAANSANRGNALACDSFFGPPRDVQVINCIIWGGIWHKDTSTIAVTYSDVKGGWPGDGNINADPYFVEPGYWDVNGVWVDGDYHLLGGSPCIDTGDPCYVAEPNETDLDGNPRIVGIAVDMGAYEFFNTLPVADAGPDQIVECACNTNEGTKVTLDGTGSYDSDGDLLTYTWTGPFIESPA